MVHLIWPTWQLSQELLRAETQAVRYLLQEIYSSTLVDLASQSFLAKTFLMFFFFMNQIFWKVFVLKMLKNAVSEVNTGPEHGSVKQLIQSYLSISFIAVTGKDWSS